MQDAGHQIARQHVETKNGEKPGMGIPAELLTEVLHHNKQRKKSTKSPHALPPMQ
jgi:hypothetical protein